MRTITIVFLIFGFFIFSSIPTIDSAEFDEKNHGATNESKIPTSHQEKLDEFESWATAYGIELVGTNRDSNYLYYNGFNPETDKINWKDIPRVLIAANALYKIPDDILQVMDGKSIYFSSKSGRSYTVLASFPDYDILEGMNRGIILEQNINEHTVIHEIGHIIDYHGIQGIYGDDKNFYSDIKSQRDEVFQVNIKYDHRTSKAPAGHITAYSAVNDAENFAENFAYYLLYSDYFKNKINSDPMLIEEFEFFKNLIFFD